MSKQLFRGGAAALALCGALAAAQAQQPGAATLCGGLQNGFGPFDYRRDRDKLPIVESNHFTAQVEHLVKGITGPLGADIDYTLRAFPNHHRALLAATRLGKKLASNQPTGMNYSIDCYYDRAVRLTPDDTVVRGLYAIYLRENNRRPEAEAQLDVGVRAAGENAFAHFNLGVQYAEMQLWDKAARQARKADELGMPRQELIEMLRKAGKWTETPAAAASPASR